MARRSATKRSHDLSIVALFAGIGGIELGFQRAGSNTALLCEIDDADRGFLTARFPNVRQVGDIRDVRALPRTSIVAAGFPCQDLSQAGSTAGIRGRQSSLVREVFRLIQSARNVRWLMLENVPFMLQLDRGRPMRFLISELETLGFTWAYRVVDSRAFGLPQRRQRVILLASREEDPRQVLFADDVGEQAEQSEPNGFACGFYW